MTVEIKYNRIRKCPHITLEAAEVYETGVGQVSWFFVVDTQEEIQRECGNHGGEKL